MCNCNQQRATYLSENNQPPKGMVKVKLVKNNSLVVNGDVTGRMYVFRNLDDVNWVDKRDAMNMKEMNELQVFY